MEDICRDHDVKTPTFNNSLRCPRRPRRQTDSELTALTPMSAFSLRNRYLSRLGAQVGSAPALCGDWGEPLPSHSICSSPRLLSAFNSLPPPAARPLLDPSVITCLQERSKMMPSAHCSTRKRMQSSQSARRSLMTHSALPWIKLTHGCFMLPRLRSHLHFSRFHPCHGNIFGLGIHLKWFFVVP